jgi:tetratricopeptide (TPR) repeat protein
VDVLLCQQCGTPQLEEDWTVPARTLKPGRCINCGEGRVDDVCQGCGLSKTEDLEVHYELRDLIDPQASLLNAAREASKLGRRVLALKLATMATSLDENHKKDTAWALRIWLLSAVGEPKPALEDARWWVEGTPDPPAVAWASFGQQLEHQGYKGAAADAYSKAIEMDDTQMILRARRARLLITMGREGTALREIARIFRDKKSDADTLEVAVEVAEHLCYAFEKKGHESEIEYLLDHGGPIIERSPVLLAYRARRFAIAGDIDRARRTLKAAKAMEPDLSIYERVQASIRPARSSWWKW